MKVLHNYIAILFFISGIGYCHAQKHTVSGFVRDVATGEELIGASVYVTELSSGTITNTYGYYSLTLPSGKYSFKSSFLGYTTHSDSLSLFKDLKINIELDAAMLVTDEIVINAERADGNIRDVHMGTIKIPIKQVMEIPAFMGEVDIIRSLQLMPGIQSAGDGNSGLYVRGGGPDQNLMLLDEAVVYNASHLFGFFSVFNADAVKDVSLVKGGMPANYGGRLSSVVDVSMKDGNNKKFEVNGGIGIIASHLTLQGPIKKDTSSFIISARRTYADVIARPFLPLFERSKPFAGSGYYFYDINAKANYRFNDKDRLFLSGYFGRDIFTFNSMETEFNTRIPWGNGTGSLRWNHLFNDKLFLNTTAIFSNYQFAFEAEQNNFEFKLFSSITDYSLKMDFYYMPSIRHTIKFGGQYIYHVFVPTSVTAKIGETDFSSGKIIRQLANDYAVYINDDFEFTEKISISAGLRGTLFQQVGPFDRFIKDQYGKNTDTIQYAKDETVKLFKHIEPRLAVRYTINNRSSIKASYTQNYQYLHMASISSVSMPTDLWVASSDKIDPQFGTQYTIGYFRNFYNNTFESSIEIYYKEFKNQIDYMDGALPGDNVGDNSDNYFVIGIGKSYGMELFLKKSVGNTTGWIGYTLAKTERQFDDINMGEPYPAKYDRRHDLSLIVIHKLKEKWTFSMVFVFATGNTMTLPVSRYMIDGRIVSEYMLRNGYRMTPYHRMDISIMYKPMKKRWIDSSWNFSVFNVYNQANPYFIYYATEGDIVTGNFQTKAKMVYLFPIIPSLTWIYKF